MLTLTDQEILIRNSVFGLAIYGKVDAVPGANQFTVRQLAGHGVGKFMGAINPWSVYVWRKATGTSALPQGQLRVITNYNNTTGTFTTAAFGAVIAVNDEILVVDPMLAAALAGTEEAYWQTFGPANVQIDNAVTHGVTLFDPGGGIIPIADITPGTYTIDRVRAGVLANIVAATPSLVVNGAVYENYTFLTADWDIGDLFIVTFTGISILIGGTTTDLPPIQIWGRIVMEPDILTAVIGKPNIQEISFHFIAAAASLVNAVLNNDGTAPLYAPNPAHSTDSNNPALPGVALLSTINFEQLGSVNIIDIFAHLEWQTEITVGGGDATNSLSMIQMSADGGATWVNMTDLFTNPNAIMTPMTREGARAFVAAITAGINQLLFRLIHYTDDTVGGPGRSTSEAQMHENSYVTIVYRKS